MTELAGTPYEAGGRLLRPPASATGLTAARTLRSGALRNYTAIEFTRGWRGVEHFIRTLRAVGYVQPSQKTTGYAILDVLDADGNIIFDYDLPTVQAFRFVKRKLGLAKEEGSP